MNNALTTILVWAYTAVVFIVHGLALEKLWGWFITPLGAPSIEFLPAIGIMITVTLLINPGVVAAKSYPNTQITTQNVIEEFAMSTIRPLFLMLLGYLVVVLIIGG